MAITSTGMAALHGALLSVIAVQGRLFGAEGMPGGGLLDALVRIDRRS